MADIGDIEPMVDEAFDFMGVGLLEDEIDDVIFQTNQFLLNSDFIGSNGPFWWKLVVIRYNKFWNFKTICKSITWKFFFARHVLSEGQKRDKIERNHI